ncbi:TPA: hypothetical protein ACUT5J_002422 [Pseudomonas aeruginosa]|uniref:hypothetical protein n=1 Tax=Pseudomonas aeruginosa TaxID=287 RepID=UPI0002D3443D|nr:hypothetical protein [Pseudomonas aeruginosa]MEB5296591.1 hypothetical protein [Pseudomonas aeruginosa]MEB5365496.1 hypothetical protein [Pseudomonas aeruginosa]MEB5372102.1 hypothetical protein [Pseudomonas aeruginosa]MEB5417163.1 hypothetical protein [Pseudomonas aeruginosa]QBN00349.1 hypothetical protein CKAES1M_03724 [Pseudomonas aeruginosa]
MNHPINTKFASEDLALALRTGVLVSEYDEPDPELLGGVEEEEEEEEILDLGDDDPDADPDDLDRGDDVDPDLGDDASDDDSDADPEGDPEDIDPEDLADLAGNGKAKMVPHARFNEVNETLKSERAARLALEEELARTRGQVPPKQEQPNDGPKPYDFDAAEDRYNDAIMSGETDKAKAIRREIRQEEQKQFERAAEEKAAATYDARRQQDEKKAAERALQDVAKQAYEDYPFLNDQGEAPNEDAIEMVVAVRDANMRKGMDAADALRKAVAKVGPMFSEKKPAKDDDPEKRSARERVIQRNLERERQIPPRGQGLGERSRVIDYSKLSEEEFDALPDTEKRRARGDFLG